MIIYSRVTTAPTEWPVTLEEAKEFLKVDGTAEDAIITRLIKTCTTLAEAYTGLSFATQTRTVMLDHFPCRDIILPYGPVTEVTGITYLDDDDTQQTVNEDLYTLDTQSGLAKVRITDTWPDSNRTLNNVVVTYTAGYGDAEEVPDIVKQAILMEVATFFENRQNEVIGSTSHELSHSSRMLLDTVKVYWSAEL